MATGQTRPTIDAMAIHRQHRTRGQATADVI